MPSTSTPHTPPQKVVLVTGAAQRIGAAICRELHQRGFAIVIHYRQSSTAALALAEQLNAIRADSARCVSADLNSSNDIHALATAATQCWGRIDALVNNASSFYPTTLASASEADWDALINSNLKGPFFLSQALIQPLLQHQGSIVNIIDIHAEKPMLGYPIYSIAKAGLAMMTKTLARELAPNIRVNGVSPGAIIWPEPEPNEEDKSLLLNTVPMQRLGEASDIAKTVAFLIEDAPYVSGQIIAIDGGRSLNM
ncbi:MAG: pteridine reductase [Spongiibacteraceae bacterium]